MNDLSQLAIDLYTNRTGEFSKEDAENTLRQELIGLFGTDKIDYKAIRGAKPEFFTILEEALDALVSRNMEEEFERFAEIRNVAYGDQLSFDIENSNLFDVAVIADGTNNLRRQRIHNGTITVETETRGVKIYDELARFLAGRINWEKLVNKVSKSYINKIYTAVYNAIYDGFNGLSATYGVSGTFAEATLRELIDHVEAAAGGVQAGIWGTKNALSKVQPANLSDNMKDAINQQGYVGVFEGTPMYKINQVHKPGTDTFAIDNNFILVLPQGEEALVKIVDEGESVILESADGNKNADMSIEYTFIKKSGIAIVYPNKWGMYKLA